MVGGEPEVGQLVVGAVVAGVSDVVHQGGLVHVVRVQKLKGVLLVLRVNGAI